MSNKCCLRRWVGVTAFSVLLLALAPYILSGCGGAVSGPGPGDTVTPPDGSGDDDSGAQAANYKGTMTGLVSESRSSRESIDAADAASAQDVPPDFDSSEAAVVFEDLSGEPLLDAEGNPYPPAPVDETGAFEAEGLPVGIDIVVAIDLDGDGEPDIEQIIQIPQDVTGDGGQVDDIVVDPLSTLIVEMLKAMLAEQGIDPGELDVSPTAVVYRVVDAFIHLYEESGVERNVDVDDIRDVRRGKAVDLFNQIVPAGVRTAFNTLEGNLALERASDLEDMVKAGAEVFLRAGFPIADDPDGVDLSFLGDLPDVEVTSLYELNPPQEEVIEVAQLEETGLESDEFDELLADGTLEELLGDGTLEDLVDQGVLDEYLGDGATGEDLLDGTLPETVYGEPGEGPVIYVSSVNEPDRNFIANDELDPNAGRHPLPVLNEHLIERVAALHLEGRTITLRDLHRLITDAEVGMGARIVYMLPTPGYAGPPPMVFETTDEEGIERNVDQMLFDLLDLGMIDPGARFDDMAAKQERVREIMLEVLAGTVPPTIERLFGPILSERIQSVEQFFGFIREARAHLPFNRSGPSSFYVIADGDPWRPDAPEVNPVSVNIEFDADGSPTRVTYDPTHAGRFHLAFTHATESHNLVQPLVRETGRWLHGPRGEPIMLDMGDETLFEAVNGEPFVEFVSEAGTFWPGVPVAVRNPEHQMGPEVQTASLEEGQTMQLYVLATAPGPDAEPVRVNYDVATGTFSSDASGRYYMMFLPETQAEGVFGLYDVEMNFMASVNDLTQDRFVEMPPPMETQPFPDEPYAPDDQVPPTEPPADQPPTDDQPPDDVMPAATGDEPSDTTAPPATMDETVIPDESVPPDDGTTPPPDMGAPPVFEPVWVLPEEVTGLTVQPEFFTFVYGTDVANENFASDANPYFDDVNGNGIEDAGEYTSDFRPMLLSPDDWRSTDVSRYYRTESGLSVVVQDVDFESPEPQTFSGEALVPRKFLPRLNAFRYGRPNSAINLLTSFLPPEFFDGTKALTEDTPLSVLQAIATMNLVLQQVFNAEALVDIDGPGPFEAERMMIDAHVFVTPIGDPLVLMLDGFEQLSERPAEPQ